MNRKTVGRYHGGSTASCPGDLPRQGLAAAGKQQVWHGVVDDPNPSLQGKRQKAAINIKTDPLENEYAQGRISEAAYRAARVYQGILEIASGRPSGGGQWLQGGRADVVTTHDATIAQSIDSARKAIDAIFEVQRIVGVIGAKVLRLVLIERLTLTQVAGYCDGKTERAQVSFYAETFRRSCEEIAREWGKAGR